MEPDTQDTTEPTPPPPRRIFPNGAICDRCDATLATRSILNEFVCPACMSDAERDSFPSLNQPEFVI